MKSRTVNMVSKLRRSDPAFLSSFIMHNESQNFFSPVPFSTMFPPMFHLPCSLSSGLAPWLYINSINASLEKPSLSEPLFSLRYQLRISFQTHSLQVHWRQIHVSFYCIQQIIIWNIITWIIKPEFLVLFQILNRNFFSFQWYSYWKKSIVGRMTVPLECSCFCPWNLWQASQMAKEHSSRQN